MMRVLFWTEVEFRSEEGLWTVRLMLSSYGDAEPFPVRRGKRDTFNSARELSQKYLADAAEGVIEHDRVRRFSVPRTEVN